ncbi:GNAT family N-acetyltransferase [Fulvivirga aurantia]|uniref:GNAT family N-acetyltransferase n=1 Tax=Fulvivirga aurantia TaxID=2529383 RepID=UPI001CA3E026
MRSDYLFTSNRLGFRNWSEEDIPPFAEMNRDPEVMAFFPETLSTEASIALIDRFKKHFDRYGFTYFAVDRLDSSSFVGFIGLQYQEYAAPFNPSVDIGWRLTRSAWGNGYATEGAKECLHYAFDNLKLKIVTSVCPKVNLKSEAVMRKIGMIKKGYFNHPNLSDHAKLETCVWYQAHNPNN